MIAIICITAVVVVYVVNACTEPPGYLMCFMFGTPWHETITSYRHEHISTVSTREIVECGVSFTTHNSFTGSTSVYKIFTLINDGACRGDMLITCDGVLQDSVVLRYFANAYVEYLEARKCEYDAEVSKIKSRELYQQHIG